MNGENPSKDMETYFILCGKNCFRQAETYLAKNQNCNTTARMRATANIIDFYNIHLLRLPKGVAADVDSASTTKQRADLAAEITQGIWWCCHRMMIMVREAEPPLDD